MIQYELDAPQVPHERDCAPCDAAKKIANAVASAWDPNDGWADTPTPYPPYADSGMSLLDDLAFRVSVVLHDWAIGGAR